MEKLKIKPLSLNMAYRGRRFTTPLLKAFKEEVYYLLPLKQISLTKKLAVKYEFGVSSKRADGDNLIKAFQDALSEKYEFNDDQIYHWVVDKKIVKKGQEYIAFEIKELTEK